MRSTVAEREDRERRKARAASLSVAASAGITVAKGAAGLATGSLALISDAAHSLLDVASTTMTWLAVRVAGKKASLEGRRTVVRARSGRRRGGGVPSS